MKRKFTSAVLLLVLVGASPGTASYSSETRCFADQNQHGEWYDFNEAVPDLSPYHFDNTIESIRETGMWMYYENVEYNTHQAGLVFWASGIDFSGNVPGQYANMATSLRYAGSPYSLNDETWTVYSGEAFTGDELMGNNDAASLGYLGDDVSSIIIVGQSAWTFYDGRDFHGTNSVCLHPNLKFRSDFDGRSLHVGIYATAFPCSSWVAGADLLVPAASVLRVTLSDSDFPHVLAPTDFHISDNNIESVRKGCWSKNVVYGGSVRPNYSSPSGAWGLLNG